MTHWQVIEVVLSNQQLPVYMWMFQQNKNPQSVFEANPHSCPMNSQDSKPSFSKIFPWNHMTSPFLDVEHPHGFPIKIQADAPPESPARPAAKLSLGIFRIAHGKIPSYTNMYMYSYIHTYICMIYVWSVLSFYVYAYSHMSSGQTYLLNLTPCTKVVPYRLWRFWYSRRYHKWGISIGSSPIGCEGFVQPQKGQGEARPN